MKNKCYIIYFLFFTWALCAISLAQDTIKDKQLVIKRGQKHFDLNKLSILEIKQNILSSNGQDSVCVVIVPDSVYRIQDTLFVKPSSVEERHFLDINNPYSTRKDYDDRSNVLLKVALNQIEKIRAKKQPVAFILGTISTLSYISYISSIFVASNEKYADIGVSMFFISAPVLAVSWTSYFIYGKKRFKFDSKRTKRRTWYFS